MLNPTSIALQIEVENTKGPMVWTFFDLPPILPTRCASRSGAKKRKKWRDLKFIINLAGETPAVEALTMAPRSLSHSVALVLVGALKTLHTKTANTLSSTSRTAARQ